MEINLLPKAPPRVKPRDKIILASVAMLLAIGSYAVVYYVELDSRIESARAALTHVKSNNIQLKAERQVTPEAKQFQELQATVDKLLKREHEYGKMLDGVAAKMSAKMRVVYAKMDAATQSLDLTVQTETMDIIAEYTELLREEQWVNDVIVGEIKNSTQSAQDKRKGAETERTWVDENGNPVSTDQLSELSQPKQNLVQERLKSASELNKEIRPYEAKITIELKSNEIPVQTDNKTAGSEAHS